MGLFDLKADYFAVIDLTSIDYDRTRQFFNSNSGKEDKEKASRDGEQAISELYEELSKRGADKRRERRKSRKDQNKFDTFTRRRRRLMRILSK